MPSKIARHYRIYRLIFRGIIYCIMKSYRLLALTRLLDSEVSHSNHIAQLAQLSTRLGAVVELLGLLPDNRKTLQSTLQTQVRAHDTNIVRHNRAKLLSILHHEDHLLRLGSALEVPIGNTLLKIDLIELSSAWRAAISEYTNASVSEFEAKRFAPCKPVQLLSPKT